MIFIYYLLAALLIFLSYRSFRGGIDYLAYFKRELQKPASGFAPFATVIVPCKGLDEGLFDNLAALAAQDYPAYELIFVVDDENDPAVSTIEKVSAKAPQDSKLVIAPRATNSSQKVGNLREAVLHADARSEIFVFADSDARPGKDWLRALAAPLEDKTVGAATGYRWFFSENRSLASELRSSWNASVASFLGPNTKTNFCWGGSMAIRRDTFEDLDIREKWSGTLSDDFAVTRAMNAGGKAIYFVPRALAPSIENCPVRCLFEFTNRQIKITRVYAAKLWLLSFFGSGLFNLVTIWSVLILFVYPAGAAPWIASLFTLLSVTVLSTGKAWLRCKAVRLALPTHSAALDRQFIYQTTLWLFTPAIFLINSATALLSKRIRWRGTEYEMVSPSETKVL